MKTTRIVYWVTTALFSVMMLMSAYMYLTAEAMQAAFVHLGFPSYFRMELAIAKMLGAVALLLPFTPAMVREWAYAGFGIVLVSGLIAHVASGDGAPPAIFVATALLVTSYITHHKLAGVPKA